MFTILPLKETILATYRPPQSVRDTARRAIQWIEEGYAGSGFTATGRRRATQLANGDAVSEDIIKRMRSYFARHVNDANAEGFNRGEDGFPSPGRVAWDAWGGNAGQRWVNDIRLDSDA